MLSDLEWFSAAECGWSGTVFWCGVWVIWNGFLVWNVGNLEWFSAAECGWSGMVFLVWSVGDQERGFLVKSVVIWNGFLVRSVGDLEWFIGAECEWSGTVYLMRSVGDLELFFWCRVWVFWNSFSGAVCVWSGTGFLVRSVGDLERFFNAERGWSGTAFRSGGCTAKKFWFMYSQKRNWATSVPIFIFVCLVSDLYIPTFGPPIFLQQNRQTGWWIIYIHRAECG